MEYVSQIDQAFSSTQTENNPCDVKKKKKSLVSYPTTVSHTLGRTKPTFS